MNCFNNGRPKLSSGDRTRDLRARTIYASAVSEFKGKGGCRSYDGKVGIYKRSAKIRNVDSHSTLLAFSRGHALCVDGMNSPPEEGDFEMGLDRCPQPPATLQGVCSGPRSRQVKISMGWNYYNVMNIANAAADGDLTCPCIQLVCIGSGGAFGPPHVGSFSAEPSSSTGEIISVLEPSLNQILALLVILDDCSSPVDDADSLSGDAPPWSNWSVIGITPAPPPIQTVSPCPCVQMFVVDTDPSSIPIGGSVGPGVGIVMSVATVSGSRIVLMEVLNNCIGLPTMPPPPMIDINGATYTLTSAAPVEVLRGDRSGVPCNTGLPVVSSEDASGALKVNTVDSVVNADGSGVVIDPSNVLFGDNEDCRNPLDVNKYLRYASVYQVVKIVGGVLDGDCPPVGGLLAMGLIPTGTVILPPQPDLIPVGVGVIYRVCCPSAGAVTVYASVVQGFFPSVKDRIDGHYPPPPFAQWGISVAGGTDTKVTGHIFDPAEVVTIHGDPCAQANLSWGNNTQQNYMASFNYPDPYLSLANMARCCPPPAPVPEMEFVDISGVAPAVAPQGAMITITVTGTDLGDAVAHDWSVTFTDAASTSMAVTPMGYTPHVGGMAADLTVQVPSPSPGFEAGMISNLTVELVPMSVTHSTMAFSVEPNVTSVTPNSADFFSGSVNILGTSFSPDPEIVLEDALGDALYDTSANVSSAVPDPYTTIQFLVSGTLIGRAYNIRVRAGGILSSSFVAFDVLPTVISLAPVLGPGPVTLVPPPVVVASGTGFDNITPANTVFTFGNGNWTVPATALATIVSTPEAATLTVPVNATGAANTNPATFPGITHVTVTAGGTPGVLGAPLEICPTLASVSPDSGSAHGPMITMNGTGFLPNMSVDYISGAAGFAALGDGGGVLLMAPDPFAGKYASSQLTAAGLGSGQIAVCTLESDGLWPTLGVGEPTPPVDPVNYPSPSGVFRMTPAAFPAGCAQPANQSFTLRPRIYGTQLYSGTAPNQLLHLATTSHVLPNSNAGYGGVAFVPLIWSVEFENPPGSGSWNPLTISPFGFNANGHLLINWVGNGALETTIRITNTNDSVFASTGGPVVSEPYTFTPVPL